MLNVLRMIVRPASSNCESDLAEVISLYSEYLQSEPCSVHLGLSKCHLDTRPGIIQSLISLIQTGNILLCFDQLEDVTALGMGIFYQQIVPEPETSSADDIETRIMVKCGGYEELCPVYCLSSVAVNAATLASVHSIKSYQYLELLVTSHTARGRGVATAIVSDIQSRSLSLLLIE